MHYCNTGRVLEKFSKLAHSRIADEYIQHPELVNCLCDEVRACLRLADVAWNSKESSLSRPSDFESFFAEAIKEELFVRSAQVTNGHFCAVPEVF